MYVRGPNFVVGELVLIDPGYNAGIWLRQTGDANVAPDANHVPGGTLLILEIDHTKFEKDRPIKVLSNCGKVGWTFESRLRVL